ncbi:MAG: flagellar biosynthetic protein FliO [Pseudomonadota bacterium]
MTDLILANSFISLLVPTADVPTGYGWALFRMLIVLVAVCLLAYVLLRFGLRKLGQPAPQGTNLRIVDRCTISTGRIVCIVEVAGRYFLLGATDGGISRLAELDPDSFSLTEEKTKSFRDWLKRSSKGISR